LGIYGKFKEDEDVKTKILDKTNAKKLNLIAMYYHYSCEQNLG
jgi:hypothetical protein